MGFNFFQKICLVLYLISFSCYYTGAFRLIHSSQQSQDLKPKSDNKESFNQQEKITLKEKTSEVEDQVKTKVIKPVQPTLPDIAEEKIYTKLTKTNDDYEDDESVIIKKELERKSKTKNKIEKIYEPESEEDDIVIEKPKQGTVKSKEDKKTDDSTISNSKEEKQWEILKSKDGKKTDKPIETKILRHKEEKETIKPKEEKKIEKTIEDTKTTKLKEEKKWEILKAKDDKKSDKAIEIKILRHKEEREVEEKQDGMKLKMEKEIEKPIEKSKMTKPEEEKKWEILKSKDDKKAGQSVEIKILRHKEEKEVEEKQETVEPKVEKKIEEPIEKSKITKPGEEKKWEILKSKEDKKTGQSVEIKILKHKEEKEVIEKTDKPEIKSQPKIEESKIKIIKHKEEKKQETVKPKEEKKIEKTIEETKAPKLKEEKKWEIMKSKEGKETDNSVEIKILKRKVEEKLVKQEPKQKIEESRIKIIKGKDVKKVEEKPKKPETKPVIKSQPKPTTEEFVPKIVKKNFNSSISSLYFSLPSFSPNFDVVETDECRNHGHILIDQMKKHKLWALKMFDATAKIPSGILKGNLNQLGDYDQCVGILTKIPIDEKQEAEIKIAGKYCLAYIDFDAEIQEMKLPVHLAQSRALIRSKLQDPGHFIPQFTTIRWGLCIPSVCSAEDAERILEDAIKTYNESENIGINFDVSVEASQCQIRKPSKKILDYDYGTLATLGLTALIVIFVLIATLRDVTSTEDAPEKEEPGKLEKILMTFSLKRTVTSLLQESDPNEIECIHGIRTICTFMLYIAHKLIPLGHLPYTNKTTLTEMSNNPFSIILRLSVIYTDSFLLLSGILTSYAMSKDMEDKGSIPWLSRIVARFVRLTPSLFFILLYYAYVLDILGEGPLWGTVITSNVKLCEESWWKNVLYIQNFYPFQKMCATHTHQLALDMQLSFVAPILVWLLYRKPLLGVFITILLHSVSVYLRYSTTMSYRLSLVIYHGISMSQLYRTANMLYASSIQRATPYIAGVSLGVLLRQIKTNFHMPKALFIIGWLIAGYFACWALYTPSHLSSRTYKYDINEAAQFAALCSLAWALALSWLIFSCFANKTGYLNLFLSSRPIIILSRISYTLYLTQFIVFFYNVGTVRNSTEFTIISSLNLTELAVIITTSTILTLLVDMPVQKIKTIILKSSPKRKDSDIPPESNDIKKSRENSLENIKKVTISEDVEILNGNEEIEESFYKYRQLSTESDPTSEDLTEDIEEILDEDEEIIQNLESKMRQFSIESEPSEMTEETEDLDDVEIVDNRHRQSSFESQPSLEDIEDINYDEETEETVESLSTKSFLKNQYSAEEVEELEHDNEENIENNKKDLGDVEKETETVDEPVQSTVKTQLPLEITKEIEFEEETVENVEEPTEDVEDISEGFVSIRTRLSSEDVKNVEHEEEAIEAPEPEHIKEDIEKQKDDTGGNVERFVFRIRSVPTRIDLSSEEAENPTEEDEEIVQHLESNIQKLSTDDNSTPQQLNDDE